MARSSFTLEEQFTASKVRRGSALEKLIKDNQNFNLLSSEESDDDQTDLPLWIRVYWRKQHPDAPVGRYPDVLNTIYQWMTAHQDLPPDPSLWYSVKEPQNKGEQHGK
jgi:hypothetical protein